MPIKLGVVMDSIETIKIEKDTTFAMLLEAQSRHWSIHYMQQQDLYLKDGDVIAKTTELSVKDDPKAWFQYGKQTTHLLSDLDIILMRKDPPFDMEYIYTTYLLELAEQQGVLVANKPQSLRDANEKLYTAWFPQCCVETMVTRDSKLLREFLKEQHEIVLKPLDGMGGVSIFRVKQGDPNTNVIIENITYDETRTVMAQRYIPEISQGDKRILMIDGELIPYALARIPPGEGEHRGNLAIGAKGVGMELSERDHWICQQVGPVFKEKGLSFVGIDIIGDYLSEINVTSPTCIRELDDIYDLNISKTLLDSLEEKIK